MNTLEPNQVFELGAARRRETIESAIQKLTEGFCLKSELTSAELGVIFEKYEHASIIKIASAGLHGGRHFSIHDLLGHSVNGMNYVVTNHERFTAHISTRLESDFLKKNREAGSRIRASFTSFMHENKLHWSRCCGGHSRVQKKAIRDKLRRISIRTGKSHTQILSELLEMALNQSLH